MASGDHYQHNLEAEKAVLGASLIDSNALIEAMTVLSPDKFYIETHRILFETMAQMQADDVPVDPVTIMSKLREAGKLERVGGASYVSAMIDVTPDTSNVPYYCSLVDDAFRMRQLQSLGRYITNWTGPTQDLMEYSLGALYKASEAPTREELHSILPAIDEAIVDALMISTGHQDEVGMPTSFDRLNRLVAMKTGKMTVIAGTTGSGKTSFALQLADDFARAGYKVGFFSLEMTEREIADRLLSRRTLIALDAITRGNLSQRDRDKLEAERHAIAKLPLFICDDADVTPADVRTRARKMQLQYGLDVVIVDYIQLMTPPKQLARRSREQEIGYMAREMKKMGKSLGVLGLMMSQLNDNPEQQRRPPELRDLRESRAIGHHADIVLMLHRPDIGCPATEMYIRKNRNGPMGKIDMAFQGPWVRFKELRRDERSSMAHGN